MKMVISKKTNTIIFKRKIFKSIVIPIALIKSFTIDKVWGTKYVPMFINGIPMMFSHKTRHINGDLIIGLDKCVKTIISKKKYDKIILKYDFIKIKNVEDVFEVSKRMTKLGLKFCDVPTKTVKKIDKNGEEIFSGEHYFTYL